MSPGRRKKTEHVNKTKKNYIDLKDENSAKREGEI